MENHRRKGILARVARVGAENACHVGVGVGLGSRGSHSYSVDSSCSSYIGTSVYDTGELMKPDIYGSRPANLV